jgi:hypothetical protein
MGLPYVQHVVRAEADILLISLMGGFAGPRQLVMSMWVARSVPEAQIQRQSVKLTEIGLLLRLHSANSRISRLQHAAQSRESREFTEVSRNL